jgi:hypothetical protein
MAGQWPGERMYVYLSVRLKGVDFKVKGGHCGLIILVPVRAGAFDLLAEFFNGIERQECDTVTSAYNQVQYFRTLFR